MTLNPNKYKASLPIILRLWEKCKDKPDINDIVNDIGLSLQIEFAAICMILDKETGDPRLPAITKMLTEFGKYDTIIQYDKVEQPPGNSDNIPG